MTIGELRGFVGAIWIGAFLGISVAFAQEPDETTLLNELANRQTAFAAVQALERIAARIVHVESVALLSEYGEWPEEETNWPDDAEATKSIYDVKNLHARLTTDLANIRRSMARGDVLDEEEKARFLGLADEVESMIADSQTLYQSLRARELSEASQFFKEHVRARYATVERASYTLGTGILRDIARIKLVAKAKK